MAIDTGLTTTLCTDKHYKQSKAEPGVTAISFAGILSIESLSDEGYITRVNTFDPEGEIGV